MEFVDFDFSAKRILEQKVSQRFYYELSDEPINGAIRYDSVALYIAHDVRQSINSDYMAPFPGALYACSERTINKNSIDEITLTSDVEYAGIAAGESLNHLVQMVDHSVHSYGKNLYEFEDTQYGGEFLIIFNIPPVKEGQFNFNLIYRMTDGSEIQKSIEQLIIKP
ncbi:hypothetical protein GCM10009122_40680 [Fulvivirga kasyanovii]|uniref:Uncharacterized protein n=1 Tax=Fulvivirga kasyanovii TaxID=396812 RepID=A0ABW9RWG3_9BACT|nr:hypothetical protein [Fulvivirga kasyanovii]MTI28318.1 hypothetical protein [Fulvivirga kasyanovii]